MNMTPLGALISRTKQRFQDEHGVPLTNGDIARRSRGALTRTRVQQLEKDPIKRLPAPELIEGLALGLGVHPTVVTEAALASAGYPVPADYALAGPERKGRPIQVGMDEAEPDPNVDPPHPDEPS
jgi:hypothetical protein